MLQKSMGADNTSVFSEEVAASCGGFTGLETNPSSQDLLHLRRKQQVLEAEECVFLNQYVASVAQSNTVRAGEMDEDETPAKRPVTKTHMLSILSTYYSLIYSLCICRAAQ